MLTAAAACVLLATGCCSLAGAAALTASAGLAAAAATATAATLAAGAAKLACLIPWRAPPCVCRGRRIYIYTYTYIQIMNSVQQCHSSATQTGKTTLPAGDFVVGGAVV